MPTRLLPSVTSGTNREIIFHVFECGLFQSAYLGLGDVDFLGDFHLGFTLEETEFDDIIFTFI